jgi:hypothetical protein
MSLSKEVIVHRLVAVALASLVAAPLLAADTAGKTMAVYVVGSTAEPRDPTDAEKQALKQKKDAAKEARKALEKQLKDENGKKRETWPPEKDDALYALEEAEALARADYEYRKIDPKAIADGVKDIQKSFEGKGTAGRKERVTLVSSEKDADLVLEVLARRSEKSLPTNLKPDWCYVFFAVRPGAKLPAAQFAKVPASYRIRKGFGWGIYKIAGPSAESPVFKFESNNLMTSGSWGSFGCFGSAANAASAAVDRFIEDNYSLMTAN